MAEVCRYFACLASNHKIITVMLQPYKNRLIIAVMLASPGEEPFHMNEAADHLENLAKGDVARNDLLPVDRQFCSRVVIIWCLNA